jgi:hypothetical protein
MNKGWETDADVNHWVKLFLLNLAPTKPGVVGNHDGKPQFASRLSDEW